jgi:hypothetical protein
MKPLLDTSMREREHSSGRIIFPLSVVGLLSRTCLNLRIAHLRLTNRESGVYNAAQLLHHLFCDDTPLYLTILSPLCNSLYMLYFIREVSFSL